ncbi:predicted protein, partial [Nematostella vectensis]
MAAYTRPMSSCFSRGRNLFNKCPYKELSFVTRRNNATFSHAAKNRSVLLGVGALAGISFGVLYSLKTQSRIAREIEQENYSSENSASNEASHQPKITLYQYQTCPFCCKVRAYLEYFGIDYTKVEVNPLTRKEIEFSTEYRKVPIAIVDGKQARASNDEDHYLLNPFGLLYNEVTASSLVKVDFAGNIVDGGSTNLGVNRAGLVLHSAVHSARKDIACVIHIHQPACVA